jgi:hypothetical protein
MEEIDTNLHKSFTTAPKTRKHGYLVSLDRAQAFMEHLRNLGLKKCSYSTLEFEFIQFFGTNEPRTLERYLGRLEKNLSYGSANLVRVNQTSGKVAQFHYANRRRILAKKGLLEILGYITRIQEGKETLFQIHHENMPYFTEQTSLEFAVSLPEVNECSDVIKDKMCACSLSVENTDNPIHSLRAEGESLREETLVGSCLSQQPTAPSIEGIDGEKEEEVIDSTHTNRGILDMPSSIQEEANRIKDIETVFAEIKKSLNHERKVSSHG